MLCDMLQHASHTYGRGTRDSNFLISHATSCELRLACDISACMVTFCGGKSNLVDMIGLVNGVRSTFIFMVWGKSHISSYHRSYCNGQLLDHHMGRHVMVTSCHVPCHDAVMFQFQFQFQWCDRFPFNICHPIGFIHGLIGIKMTHGIVSWL